jgi:hypothetical protein
MRTVRSSVLLVAGLLSFTGCIAGEDEIATGDELDLTETKPRRFAPDQQKTEDNYRLWSEYCIGDREATQRPMPNYKNAFVMEAATQLSRVSAHSFSLYSDISAHHKTKVPDELAGSVKNMAHEFLGYLCGEFRDRATMVEAKVKWVANMNYLDDEESEFDPAGDPWSQMRAKDYDPYIQLTDALWDARQSALSAEGKRYTKVGSIETDTPVVGMTVCETRYIFADYVRKDRAFDSLEAFKTGYEAFKTENCNLPEDEDYYYDFRGDSNIKPNSPESNGMIWFSRSLVRQCDARPTATPYQTARPETNIGDAACQRYFKYPFTERWNAARAGLATWVLVDPANGGLDSNSQYTVIPRHETRDDYLFGDLAPYRATNQNGEPVKLLPGYIWKYGALGLPEMHANDKEKINRLIQIAVDRHTDWYNSGYDDQMPYKTYTRDQAYSPFVASSYEMSKSDSFVTPGTTVPVIDESSRNFKHWMFVFKIHKDNWYTPERINAEDQPVPNFDRYWFDETSFGDTGLANTERAWDRLGTALEGELEALLYLHNLPSG